MVEYTLEQGKVTNLLTIWTPTPPKSLITQLLSASAKKYCFGHTIIVSHSFIPSIRNSTHNSITCARCIKTTLVS